jgi:hypothetical protein
MKREYLMYKDLIECGLAEKHNNLLCKVLDIGMYKRPNYVYVLTGYFPRYGLPIVKIGTSYNPFARYENICKNCAYPVFIDYLLMPIGYGSLEINLHRAFKNNRIENKFLKSGSTEWFIGIDAIDVIAEYKSIESSVANTMSEKIEWWELDYSKHFKPNSDEYFSKAMNYNDLLISMEEDRQSIIKLALDRAAIFD